MLDTFYAIPLFLVGVLLVALLPPAIYKYVNKKEAPESKKPTFQRTKFSIVFTDQVFDIGRTQLLTTFEDGRTVKSWVYGSFHQWKIVERDASDYYGYHPPQVGPVTLRSSITVAEETLTGQAYNAENTTTSVLNDAYEPTEMWKGVVVRMRIGKTEPYSKSFEVAELKGETVTEEYK